MKAQRKDECGNGGLFQWAIKMRLIDLKRVRKPLTRPTDILSPSDEVGPG
jgi:hypothetical protein